jgi:hypothetical protein
MPDNMNAIALPLCFEMILFCFRESGPCNYFNARREISGIGEMP